tara:strand:+ start:4306 stop:5055 length:750 start_codon:yes stop_codon:yes gene_type:complete
MKLYIDNREPKEIINYLKVLNDNNKYTIEISNLDLGDYLIYDENTDKTIVIIERKSLSDLECSIKDGRYNEQSFRLDGNILHNHNIYYLIEGNIINYKNEKFKKTLYSSLVSISYYKGFSILNSVNNIESAEIINGFVNKLLRENNKECYYKNIIEHDNSVSKEDYVNVIKTSKKANVTPDNIDIIMLMQIPNVSYNSAITIINKFITLKNLITELENDNECINSLKLESSNRKISKNVVENIKQYLLK